MPRQKGTGPLRWMKRAASSSKRVRGEQCSLWQGDIKICNNFSTSSSGRHPWCTCLASGVNLVGPAWAWQMMLTGQWLTKLLSLSLTVRREVVKSYIPQASVAPNKNMKCWKRQESDACPLQATTEDVACDNMPDPWAQWHFEQSITKVHKFLWKMQMEPHIANIICEWLLAWQQGWDLVPS